ncbi:hypothetical protein Aperf_G00000066503 [Anoplocephala perfoliata]
MRIRYARINARSVSQRESLVSALCPSILDFSLDDSTNNPTADTGAPMISSRSSPSTSSTTSPPNASQLAPRFPPTASNANAAAVIAAAVAASRYSPQAPAATPSSLQDAAAVFSVADFTSSVASSNAVAMAAAAAAAAVAAYPQADSAAGMMSVPSPIFPPPLNNGHSQLQQRLSPATIQQSGSIGENLCKPDFLNASDFFEAFARTAGNGVGAWRGQQTSKPDRLGFPSTEALLECCRAQ